MTNWERELDSSFRWNDELGSENWIPAFAGMTNWERELDSSFRWNDELGSENWIPASYRRAPLPCAGMKSRGKASTPSGRAPRAKIKKRPR
jgi:hypothetical protein